MKGYLILSEKIIGDVLTAMRASILRHCAAPAPESRALGAALQREYLQLTSARAEFAALYDLWGWGLVPPLVPSTGEAPAPSAAPGGEAVAIAPAAAPASASVNGKTGSTKEPTP